MFLWRRFLVLISMIVFIILLSIATIAITPPHLFSIHYSVEKQDGDASVLNSRQYISNMSKLELSGLSCDKDKLDLELDN